MDRRWVRAGSWSAAAVLGAGLLSGVSWAAAAGGGSTGSAPSSAGAASSPSAGAAAHRGRPGLLRRLEHGELTIRTRRGDETLDVQQGTADPVSSTSVTVTSRDGFRATYALTSTTRVWSHGSRVSPSAIHQGDKVRVVGEGGRALRVFDPTASATG
jgi:hypothetical protein